MIICSSDHMVDVDGDARASSIPKSSRIKIDASLADCGSALGRGTQVVNTGSLYVIGLHPCSSRVVAWHTLIDHISFELSFSVESSTGTSATSTGPVEGFW